MCPNSTFLTKRTMAYIHVVYMYTRMLNYGYFDVHILTCGLRALVTNITDNSLGTFGSQCADGLIIFMETLKIWQ